MPGANCIIEKMDGVPWLRVLPQYNSPRASELTTMLTRFISGGHAVDNYLSPVRLRTTGLPSDGIFMKETSSHLARLWAHDETERLLSADKTKNMEAAIQLAAHYQIVTQITGAVVLETKQQFKDAGLEPVEPGSVPTIPEPEFWALLVVVIALIVWQLKRQGMIPQLVRL